MEDSDLHMPLDQLDTYLYYDGPQLFTALDAKGQLCLAMALPDDEEFVLPFLVAKLDAGQLAQLQDPAGPELRAAFDGTLTDQVYAIGVPPHSKGHPFPTDALDPIKRRVSLDEIQSKDWLPGEGARLGRIEQPGIDF